ncbi:restriction endonuclease subunit S [Nocardiopsis sp. EMB25]|uniref:restriction endonuclease subunit S n=1 Tax=Nocardiopsis sp. EMB25 TaxID=2835867 RepID=UPI0022853430|nr:restriction endonuclease subunit S [Nocardiopsis sp. EMB25]MCY9784197.1 restriction endonuclease subunit S [Nocardiopsis sp. EMB25]
MRLTGPGENGRERLGEIARVKAGPSGAHLKELGDHPDGIPVVTPADFTDDHRVDPRHLRRVPRSHEPKLASYVLEAGDLLVVRQGSLGRLALIEPGQVGWVYGSSCLRVRLNPQTPVMPEYLAAYLSQPQTMEALRKPALSGTVPSFNAAALRDLDVVVPPWGLQGEIVDTLTDMNAAITAKRAVVERMEALRPSVFAALLEGTWV